MIRLNHVELVCDEPGCTHALLPRPLDFHAGPGAALVPDLPLASVLMPAGWTCHDGRIYCPAHARERRHVQEHFWLCDMPWCPQRASALKGGGPPKGWTAPFGESASSSSLGRCPAHGPVPAPGASSGESAPT